MRSLAVFLTVLAGSLFAPSTAHATPNAPIQVFSYYLETTDQTTLYNLGYDLGQAVFNGTRPQDAIVVLDWGEPYCNGSTCGTYTFAPGNPFVSTATERAATEQFGKGYYVGTASDSTAELWVAMGTNNYGSWFSSSANNYQNASSHGSWWAGTVTKLNDYFVNNGYSSQVTGWGGIDAELGWNGPDPTEAWGSGYQSNWTSPGLYADFGDAAGCPPVTSSCQGAWKQRGVWLMSYGYDPAVPLPDIYNNSNAEEWGGIADYSFDSQAITMVFQGSLSQYQACLDTNNACNGVDNTAKQAWTDLYGQLNCSNDCPSPQTPPNSDDIRWHLSV